VSRNATFRSCRAIIVRSVKLSQNRYRSWFLLEQRDIWWARKYREWYVARSSIYDRHTLFGNNSVFYNYYCTITRFIFIIYNYNFIFI